MLGAIAGDVIGSCHEYIGTKTKQFPLFVGDSSFTDDSVLSVAVADAITRREDYRDHLRAWALRYPWAGYGGWFITWMQRPDAGPYNSYGNGSAMRAGPIGWAFDDLESVLDQARKSAAPTHNHPEGVRGAEAAAGAVFVARTTRDRDAVRDFLSQRMGYDCANTLEALRPGYTFDVTCQGSLPAAAIAFLESTDYEDAVRNAISIGGDADTLACIAGAIAEAFYGGVPPEIRHEVLTRLDAPLRDVTLAFMENYRVPSPQVA